MSNKLVIDACVGAAAGSVQTQNPLGKICRDVLKKVQEKKYLVVMQTKLEKEWLKHGSRYAKTWLIEMSNHKLLIKCNEEMDDDLRIRLEKSTDCDSTGENFRIHDYHLIQYSLASSKKIISRDRRARDRYSRSSEIVEEIRGILWINPETEPDKTIGWLDSGIPNVPELALYCGRNN